VKCDPKFRYLAISLFLTKNHLFITFFVFCMTSSFDQSKILSCQRCGWKVIMVVFGKVPDSTAWMSNAKRQVSNVKRQMGDGAAIAPPPILHFAVYVFHLALYFFTFHSIHRFIPHRKPLPVPTPPRIRDVKHPAEIDIKEGFSDNPERTIVVVFPDIATVMF
jgi:hypothetical protein